MIYRCVLVGDMIAFSAFSALYILSFETITEYFQRILQIFRIKVLCCCLVLGNRSKIFGLFVFFLVNNFSITSQRIFIRN